MPLSYDVSCVRISAAGPAGTGIHALSTPNSEATRSVIQANLEAIRYRPTLSLSRSDLIKLCQHYTSGTSATTNAPTMS